MSQRTFPAQTPLQALVLEPALLLAPQLARAADAAPDGQGLAQVEAVAVPAARERARPAVQATRPAQAQAAETTGRPAAVAPTATSSPGTRARPAATS